MFSNRLKTTALALFALLSLATVSGAMSTLSFGAPPSPPVVEQILTVTRIAPIDDLDNLNQDIAVALAATDLSAMPLGHADRLTASDIKDHMLDLRWRVLDTIEDDPYYKYYVDSDGIVHRICIEELRVTIDDGLAPPILVTLTSTQDV